MNDQRHFSLAAEVQTVLRNRGEREEELWETLVSGRFRGYLAEIVLMRLTEYAIPFMTHLIYTGEIYGRTFDVGHPVKRRQFMAPDTDVPELAVTVVSDAVRTFIRRALAGKGWRSDGGSSIADYFLNTCVFVFSNAYNNWWRRYDPCQVPYDILADSPAPETAMDEAELRQFIREYSGCSDEETLRIVQMRIDKWSFREIADTLGITARRAQKKYEAFIDKLRKQGLQ
ncbi:hypothetical protein GCM10009682_38730 [Luedemannella flava]|uniref:Sigma-70 family RNA polymerase sigma factor n=1 Tax=Luedemannella flava TaxID=349316 RepID=A0ABP4YK87_9ACTN